MKTKILLLIIVMSLGYYKLKAQKTYFKEQLENLEFEAYTGIGFSFFDHEHDAFYSDNQSEKDNFVLNYGLYIDYKLIDLVDESTKKQFVFSAGFGLVSNQYVYEYGIFNKKSEIENFLSGTLSHNINIRTIGIPILMSYKSRELERKGWFYKVGIGINRILINNSTEQYSYVYYDANYNEHGVNLPTEKLNIDKYLHKYLLDYVMIFGREWYFSKDFGMFLSGGVSVILNNNLKKEAYAEIMGDNYYNSEEDDIKGNFINYNINLGFRF